MINKRPTMRKNTKKKTNKKFPAGSFKLPIQTAIIVPSTDFDKKISANKFNDRIKETKKFMSNLFGGYTSVRSKGGYVSNRNALIQEKAAVVVAYSTKDNFPTKRKQLFNFVKRKKKAWNQESIGVIIENDLAYI